MDVRQYVSLPTANSDEELANKFQVYFKEKISKIREEFTINSDYTVDPTILPVNFETLSTFELATEDELHAIIMSYGISCSPDDPIHVNMLSNNIDLILPLWLEIVNLSLSTGRMDSLKSAVISPLLKELDEFVDCEVFQNFRPVSNLTFLSKIN